MGFFGLRIVDDTECVPVYDNRNYKSVYMGEAASVIDSWINQEIKESKYLVTSEKPKCINSY